MYTYTVVFSGFFVIVIVNCLINEQKNLNKKKILLPRKKLQMNNFEYKIVSVFCFTNETSKKMIIYISKNF